MHGPEEGSALQALGDVARWPWLTFRRAAWHSRACRLTRSSSACLLLSSSADLAMFSKRDRRLLVPLEAPGEMTTNQACPMAPCHRKHPGETQTPAAPRETCSPAAFSCPSAQVRGFPQPTQHMPVWCRSGTMNPAASQQAQASCCLTCLQWSCFLIRGGRSCHLIKASSTLQRKRVKCPARQAGPVLRSPRRFGSWCLQALSPAMSVPCHSPALLMPPCTAGASAAFQPPRAVPARTAAEKASWSQEEEGAQQQVDCCLGQRGWAFKADVLTSKTAKS